jgi:hypothetical protein
MNLIPISDMEALHRDKMGDKVFDVVQSSSGDFLEWLFSIYTNKLPKAKVVKKSDHLVVILSGEIFKVTPYGIKYGVS